MTTGHAAGYPNEILEKGFAIVPDIIDQQTITRLRKYVGRAFPSEASAEHRRPAGVRDLFKLVPASRELESNPGVRVLVDPIEGAGARVVRSIFFDKNLEANWKVAWHQDLTIAVRERIDTPGFSAWSVKAGIAHVQAPACVLEQVLTVRLHLDDTDETNGALHVLPGSHRRGRLNSKETAELKERTGTVTCAVPAGGALIMRPLLLHSSSAGSRPSHRRVVHLEFSAAKLPGGLVWHGA